MSAMPSGASLPPDGAVEAAIARVLEAERAAREAVTAAEREAARLDEEARGRARAIGERCERRIRSVLAVHDAHVTERVAALEAAGATLGRPHTPDAAEMARVARAVAALADELIGGAA
jgi:hypothetical protein